MDPKPLNQLLDLSGKTVIVTGAVGIGYGIAYRLAEAGANVLIASLIEQEAVDSSNQLKTNGWNASYIKADVSKEEDVKKVIEKALADFRSIDILVNNAGIYPNTPLVDLTLENFEKVIDVNLKGVFLMTKYASEQMIKQGNGGKIINMTSIDALHPSMIGLSAYDASKHGVWGFTKNTALELAQYKIWVNAIAPGGIITPGVKAMQKNTSQENSKLTDSIEHFLNKIPMHRFGEPDEIGKVALFLASEMSSYITGTQIVVDGGVLLS